MTPNKNFLNYLWEDWIEMVIGSLNIEQKIIDCTEWKLNWATKVRVRKGYFCNWFRKIWPTLTSPPNWNTTKYWTPPFLFPLLINMSHLKFWSPRHLYKGEEGGGNYVTCLATHVIHIELAGDLSTDSFQGIN